MFKKNLVQFINDHRKDGNQIFWPDLSSAHHSDLVTSWMDQNINFVKKDTNPPNVPHATPIEDFWGYLRQTEYQEAWEAKN